MSAIVLFDGVCNLCNASVGFIIDRDPEGHFSFAPLQSAEAQRLMGWQPQGAPDHGSGAARNSEAGAGDFSSVVLIENGRMYRRSTAALRIARRLSGAWPLLYAFILVPPPLRDAIYNLIARNRYRWFGREDTCRIPTPELRRRFLSTA